MESLSLEMIDIGSRQITQTAFFIPLDHEKKTQKDLSFFAKISE